MQQPGKYPIVRSQHARHDARRRRPAQRESIIGLRAGELRLDLDVENVEDAYDTVTDTVTINRSHEQRHRVGMPVDDPQ
jgi:hypothetical protein